MDNVMGNGAVLPSGLLSHNSSADINGFNKSYKNYPLRVGIITTCYPITDPNNVSKLTNEYDVMVFEQQEDTGTSIITYKNCMAADGLGAIADFFEKTLRVKQATADNTVLIDTKNQNGSVVLILCLNGVAEKAIILGAINHPDRKTTLVDGDPHLEGEYNGLNIKVEKDGSATLTFKGATDNNGNPIDKTQGNTILAIEKDGSFQANHDSITQRLDRSGKADLTAKDNISNTTDKDFNVTAKGGINLTATKDLITKSQNITATASGSATLNCNSLTISAQSAMQMTGQKLAVQAASLANIQAPQIVLDGQVSLGGVGGVPILLLTTQMIGVGNLGSVVISTPFAAFANKVTGQ